MTKSAALVVAVVAFVLCASLSAACEVCGDANHVVDVLALNEHEEAVAATETSSSLMSLSADVSQLDTNHELLGWTMFKQCDGRWGSNQLGTCSRTICQAGCAMSSVSMMLNTKGHGTDPGSLNTWLKGHGGYAGGCNIVWGSVNAYGVSFQGIENPSYDVACSGLRAGHGIIANVRGGSHWVLLTGCTGSNAFTVNDPGFNQSTYSFGEVLHMAVYH